MLVLSLSMLLILSAMPGGFILCVVIFILAWIGLFIGHHLEGKQSSFFKDLQFLLIGPIWPLGFVFETQGLRW